MPDFYREPERQQFHFSCRRGWLNDPNGLCFYRGICHLFYQHNPGGVVWGPMHWGHATSRDLLHWEEQEIALFPDEHGTIFSGGAVVDLMNVSGLGTVENPPLLFFYTAAGTPFTQNLAVSLDGGRTLVRYAGNPVVPNLYGDEERDPSVAFDPEAGKWRMALYLGDRSQEFALLESTNLLDWRETDRFPIEGGRECPELLRLKNRRTGGYRWVLLEANGRYLVGGIERGRFLRENAGIFMLRPGDRAGYAGQTFKNQPDGRCLYIAWQQDIIRGDRFSQSMTLPVELRLEGGELRVFPAAELEHLRGECRSGSDVRSLPLEGELFELDFQVPETEIILNLGGCYVAFDLAGGELRCNARKYPLPSDARHWRAWLDRNTLELFEGEGRCYFALPLDRRAQGVVSVSGAGELRQLSAWRLHATLPAAEQGGVPAGR